MHRWVGAAVLAASAFFAVGIFWIEHQTGYSGISNRTVPIIVTLGLGLCGLGLMFSPRSLDGAQDDGNAGQPAQYGALAWIIAGLLLTMVLIGWLGFPLSCLLLMVCVARGYGSRRPLRDSLVSLAITVPLWLVFTKLLSINLPLLPLLGI